MDPFEYERMCAGSDKLRIAGADEVGRGALAGPILAAAVVLPHDFDVTGIADSKNLSERARGEGFSRIAGAASIAWAWAGPRAIDRAGVHPCNVDVLRRAIERLNPAADYALIDAHAVDGLSIPSRSVVHGESLSVSIAAASVVAKVIRDRLMVRLGARYLGYGFERNKGYGTEEHARGIQQF